MRRMRTGKVEVLMALWTIDGGTVHLPVLLSARQADGSDNALVRLPDGRNCLIAAGQFRWLTPPDDVARPVPEC